MPRKVVESTSPTEPRPTRSAFKPAGKEDLKADLIIAGILMAGFLLGLLANVFGDFSSFASATERGLNSTLTPILLQLLVYFGFPVFLIGTVYFLWHAWNYRRKTTYFQKNHLRVVGQITHLWKEPHSGSGKRYYVGYCYNGDYSAYLQIDVYMFKRLQMGVSIQVDYLPNDPFTSYPELPDRLPRTA